MMFKEHDATADAGTGASRISWEHDSAARNLLWRIMEECPDGNDRIWAEELQRRAPREGCEWSIYLYFAHNHALALKRGRRKRSYSRPAAVNAAKARLRARLLDLVMPNGKPLRDCTGKDCERFGKADEQRGRWLRRIATEVGPRRRVGVVLSERQLAELRR